MQAKVLVVGSLNMDLVVRARAATGGETLAGQSFTTIPGGRAPTRRSPRRVSALGWR